MLALPPALHPRTAEQVQTWAADPSVVGVVWVGSRSRGYGDSYSDDDLEVYLAPEAFARVDPLDSYVMEPAPEADPPRLIFDAQLTSLAKLHAKHGTARDLDHWPYERAQLLFDRTGALGPALLHAATMDPGFRRARIQHGALDLALAIGRAKKTYLRGFRAGTSLLVGRGAKALARVVFALEDRWVPLDHWLEPELRTLRDPDTIAPLLVEAVANGRYEPLVEALERLEPRLASDGFPAGPGRARFFSELMHPDRARERAIHGLD
ncbi:MAG: hypothetical protein JWM80_990 [Cyanobacteria bacterium RYN_339]|nr:hypothetical protein [Cyanobacteria bacterium RYN_339]